MRVIDRILLLISLALSACAFDPSYFHGMGSDISGPVQTSTFERYLPRAQAGEPDFQNLIGFMFFFGEGAPLDRSEAHLWFHNAADQGHVLAQRNLAIMHRLGIGMPRDIEEARFYARAAGITDIERLVASASAILRSTTQDIDHDYRIAGHNMERGETTYVTFCAGCHGLNGIAAYIGSPSFALGDRLHKPDRELLYSIFQGKGVMPSWGDKFPEQRLREVLGFVRTLPKRYDNGIAEGIRRAPGLYFLFGPMEDDNSAYSIAFEN